jgi:hypothetical protein
MDSFTKHPFHPWGLLSSIHLCCPRPTPLLQSFFFTASLLEILAETEVVSIEDGVLTSSTAEGTSLLRPDLISTASLAPPTVMAGKAAIGSATGGRIHATNCAISPLPPFISYLIGYSI